MSIKFNEWVGFHTRDHGAMPQTISDNLKKIQTIVKMKGKGDQSFGRVTHGIDKTDGSYVASISSIKENGKHDSRNGWNVQ
ncbi:hypothetical protein LU646_28900 [Pseudomonas alloputida]|uniref:hypothetical protein n=1 Tax=Pseudomonas alloputida TaxID=1940621 RepID=UPI001E2E62F3|nr:hypothetical protein [Pseudomonas alloputida]MCE1061862.1 hypothetical protein [Pseudomonas alloputida]